MMMNKQEPDVQKYPLFSQQITFLPSSELEITKLFYQDILGLQLVRDQGDCVIFRVSISAFLGFCLREKTPDAEKIILTLVSQDVDTWHNFLCQRGVRVETRPQYNPKYGIYHFFFSDPNGYKIEIQRFDQSLI